MAQDKNEKDLDRDIDANLRRVYEDVLSEPVPERFKELLERLKSAEDGASKGEKDA